MSLVFAKRADANKVDVVKGKKLAELIGGASIEEIGLLNWGTKEKPEITRALVELVGCQKLNDADLLQSELDPALGTGGKMHRPEPWTPTKPLELGATYTFKLKKLEPMPAVAITELTAWFTPGAATTLPCTIKYRLEGLAGRADKTDLEVHVARYIELEKGVEKIRSSYYEVLDDIKRSTKMARKQPLLTEAENPTEYNERACGTDGPDDTHIWTEQKTGVTPSEVTVVWKGQSTAKKGVLGPPKNLGPNPDINSSCAPYSVLIRYYKNDEDKTARIRFNESFYPRWKVEAGGNRKLDPTSLVVKWTVEQSNKKKLKLGQLQVFDKTGAIVCRVALDETKLLAGKLDLSAVWPESEVKRDATPYRVQIQAHSGPDEPEGLALAVMPTQVKAYAYKRVQYLAFNVRPPSPYAGDADHDVDIAARCDAMIEAVQKAKAKSNPSPEILKIFMAPEFYFRGLEGGYPVERIESIMPKLRVESDKIEYADWIFVFGSAIGYQKHDLAGVALRHTTPVHDVTYSNITATEVTLTAKFGKTKMIIPLADWWLVQGTKAEPITGVTEVRKYEEYKVTFLAGPNFVPGAGTIKVPAMDVVATDPTSVPVTRIRVKGKICGRIPPTAVGGKRWEVWQATVGRYVTACARVGTTDEYWLTLGNPGNFTTSRVELREPISTEVTNAALVQKGYPSPYMGDKGLRSVAVYKEKVSPIDFKKTTTDWHKVDGSHRLISIHGTNDRPVLPTEGSDDLVGASPNVKREVGSTVGSEINKSSIGGGVVYTMDDITFGLEVCLDHAKDRLATFYAQTSANKAVAGDPKVQLHLIPSWGMSIGQGKTSCPPNTGSIFNVDGARWESVARVNDGTWSCDDHPEQTGVQGGFCTKVVTHYWCPSCVDILEPAPGNCHVHTTVALVAYNMCGAPKRYACSGTCAITNVPCAHPQTVPLYQCFGCWKWHRVGTDCTCTNPKPTMVRCEQYYAGNAMTPCPTCGKTDKRCGRFLQGIGRAIPTNGAPVDVPTAIAKYFQRAGTVVGYNPVDIPPPDVVV